MSILPKSSAVSFSILILLLIPVIFSPTVRSIDSDGKNTDQTLCPNSDPYTIGVVTCAVRCIPDQTNPVCGVNGVTYACGCKDAHCNGTPVAKLGSCLGSGVTEEEFVKNIV